MKKQLKVIRCPDPMRWYAGLIGQTLPFLGDTGSEYKSREPAGYINFVQHADAQIIELPDDR